MRTGRKTSLKTTPPKPVFLSPWIRIIHLKIMFQRCLKSVFKTVFKFNNENFTKNGLQELTGFSPTSAAATAAHGGSWWLGVASSSFSLLPCTLSLLLPCCRGLPLPFSLFSFLFSLGFSLVFLYFSFLPFFSLFSFLSQVNK